MNTTEYTEHDDRNVLDSEDRNDGTGRRGVDGTGMAVRQRQEGSGLMEQKVYKVMRGAGAANIAVGVISLVVGLVSGIILIISGAKLLAGKSKILF